MENQTKWPFVTLPSFPYQAAITRRITGALMIATNPMVEDINRNEWENYIVRDDGSSWMQDSLDYQNAVLLRPESNTALEYNNTNSDSININTTLFYPIRSSFPSKERDPGPGPYVVSWLLIYTQRFTERLRIRYRPKALTSVKLLSKCYKIDNLYLHVYCFCISSYPQIK
jgi:hypothetical protein